MTVEHAAVLQAIAATAAAANGLFFFGFWRRSGDALFGYFGGAFVLLSLSWLLLALFSPHGEAESYIYAIRLLAFLLLIAGMIAKNRG